MAEPIRPSLSAVELAERDDLLATKLHVPRPRREFLSRTRLLERLTEGVTRELTLVCTPAGFGKTTLLADWARQCRRPLAWLSLDEADNDPVRFWSHVAAALDRACSGIADRVAPLLQGPHSASVEGVAATLVNELTAGPDEVVLVLDDYHLIQAPPIHASLEFLLEHLPASLRLVVASRADPPLPLARLRAGGQLAELRERDLRFTLEEAAELLPEAVGPDLSLPEAAVAALASRTEGWAVGLQLAALSLRGRVDADQFVAAFSGSHRYVLDYLAEEVLDRQPPELRSFLLETSVLERLSGPLCDAVTGRGDSQALLEQVERASLFLLPLDEVRGWWRYHQLFADLLRARLQQQQPERVTQRHRSAAAWCEAHGLVDDAIRHGLAGGDAGGAARLVERHFEAVLGRREDATLRRWLQGLPAEVVRSRPRLCLAEAFWALISGHVEAVERLLEDAERSFADAGDEPYEPTVGRDASLLANVPAAIARMRASAAHLRGDPEQTITFARRALAELDEGEWMLESVTRWNLIAAEWLAGRPAKAERAFRANLASIAAWRRTGLATLATWGYHHLGQVQRAQGRLGAALDTYQEALEATAKPGRPAMPAAGVAHVGIAEVAYERDELDRALHHATEGVALARQIGWTLPLVAGLSILARIRRAQGDHVGALNAIGEAEQVRQSDAVVGLLNPLPVVRARLALARGEVAEVTRWVQQRGLAVEDQPSYPREPEYLVLARVLLAQQAPQRALGLLGRLYALAAGQGRTGSVIEVRALQALALSASGDQAGALAALGEALALAAPEGYLRVFVDEGAPVAALLGKFLTAGEAPVAGAGGVPPDYLVRLTEAFEQAGQDVLRQPRRAAPQPGLVVPLTARELEVLQLLAAGRSNQAIAEVLVISLDTVKRHVTHILGKLQAANRAQAVIRARELQLLR
jgi:LuxR family transcriptional regulator, maltose regulon positive regulatory protein